MTRAETLPEAAREEHGASVVREALHLVAARMPGEPPRHAAFDGQQEDVGVAVVLGA